MKSDIQAETRSANCGKNNTPKDIAGDKFTPNAGTSSKSGVYTVRKDGYKHGKFSVKPLG